MIWLWEVWLLRKCVAKHMHVSLFYITKTLDVGRNFECCEQCFTPAWLPEKCFLTLQYKRDLFLHLKSGSWQQVLVSEAPLPKGFPENKIATSSDVWAHKLLLPCLALFFGVWVGDQWLTSCLLTVSAGVNSLLDARALWWQSLLCACWPGVNCAVLMYSFRICLSLLKRKM